jgi:hypothetical protein
MLKNAKPEFFHEHEAIATYTAIETLADSVGDKDTAKLAREIRREEEPNGEGPRRPDPDADEGRGARGNPGGLRRTDRKSVRGKSRLLAPP